MQDWKKDGRLFATHFFKKSKVFALREAVVVHHHRVRRHVLGVGVPHQPSVAYGAVHVHLSKLYIDIYPDIILILGVFSY